MTRPSAPTGRSSPRRPRRSASSSSPGEGGDAGRSSGRAVSRRSRSLCWRWSGSGDHLLVVDTAYGPTRELCDGLLTRLGVEVEYYDPLIGAAIAELIRPTTTAIWMESPGTHTFEIQDVPAIVAAARAADHRVLTGIDNTWGSPGLFRPFDHGVDVSVVAITKYWGGHADLVMGAVFVGRGARPRVPRDRHPAGDVHERRGRVPRDPGRPHGRAADPGPRGRRARDRSTAERPRRASAGSSTRPFRTAPATSSGAAISTAAAVSSPSSCWRRTVARPT